MKESIVISPWSKKLRDGSYNPKNYPSWQQVIDGLKEDYDIIQIGVDGEQQFVEDFRTDLPMPDVINLLREAKTWISVDNFLPHLAHLYKIPGVVLWGESDPLIFGYPENKNLLKSREYLRTDQFGIWDGRKYRPEIFVAAEVVLDAVRS